MDLVKIKIIPSSYQLNFGLNSSVDCTVTVYVNDFNDNPVSGYAISIDCPDDSSQTTQTGITNANGTCTFNYTFSDTNGSGYKRFIVNNVISDSVFLYRDTGWVEALDYKSGYSNMSGSNVQMRVVDKVVQIQGFFTNASAVTTSNTGSGLNFATMKYPEFAPKQGVMEMMVRFPNKWFLELSSTGQFWMARHGTTTTNTQIAAGAWLQCDIMYMI